MTGSDGDLGDLTVAVIGAGEIGLCMAAVFADAGAAVGLVEPSEAVRAGIPARLAALTAEMDDAGLARHRTGSIDVCVSIDALPARVDLVIEAGPEDVSVKRRLFAALRNRLGDAVPIATTSSAITVSMILESPEERRNCLVVHPANPPTLIRVIECVPSPVTDPAVTAAVADTLASAGFAPVMLKREVEGFALNRLQSALLREAYRLVEAGIVDVEGAERIVSEGLGPRWALSGPFETADLNTPGGILAHAKRLGPAYARIGRENGEKTLPWSDDLVTGVARQRRKIVPEAARPARVAWRRKALVRILKAKAAARDLWEAERPRDE